MDMWKSKIVVYADANGDDCVSAALPPRHCKFLVFDASGPYMPISWPAPKKVGNARAWMVRLCQQGFAFQPSSLYARIAETQLFPGRAVPTGFRFESKRLVSFQMASF